MENRNNNNKENKSKFQNANLSLNLSVLIREEKSCSSSLFQFSNQFQNSYSNQFTNLLSENTPNLMTFKINNQNLLNLKQNQNFFNENNYFGEDTFDENSEDLEELKLIKISSFSFSKKINQKNIEDKKNNKLILKKKIKKQNKKLKKNNLKKLFFINPLTFDYLLSIFSNKKLDIGFKDFEELNLESKSFIFFILHRKMNKQKNFKIPKLNLRDNNLIKQKINHFRNFCSGKRFLENLSFVFKSFINYQKKYLKLNDEKIIQYYFKKISFEKNIDIKDFSDPSKKLNPKFKNFTGNYLKFIIQSSLFKKDFIYFLNFTLIENYFFKIKNKFRNLLKKLEEKLIKKIGKKEFYDENIFYDYFIKNSQCKLPWCISELKEAVNVVVNKINK